MLRITKCLRTRTSLQPSTLGWICALSLFCLGLLSVQTAWAADQFTLDAHPDSFGAVVTDAAGNGYVAWERKSSGADIPMFCKLPAGTTQCQAPVALTLPGGNGDDANNALALFPILGPGNVIWIVTSRYIRDDTVIWTSDDGGQTFGAPHEIPTGTVCNGPTCVQSQSYTDQTTLDDTLALNANGGTYDRQNEPGADNQPFVPFLQSSANPDLGSDYDWSDEEANNGAGLSAFTFSNPGAGGIGGSALGTTSAGDVIEAYWLASSPTTLAYYYYTPTAQHSYVGYATPSGWMGPVSLGNGYAPRLADGAAGAFMLSADGSNGQQPTAIDIRKWSTATHSFGPPQTIAGVAASAGDLYDGGGLGENYDTGEIAAVWPSFNGTPDQLRLFLSTDGGASFSPAQDVATVGSEYAGPDNARVAIADNGTGFVTFQDSRGLEVADLLPLAAQYTPKVSGHALGVPVTCGAPSHGCAVKLTLTLPHLRKVLKRTFELGPGVSGTLKLRFTKPVLALLKSRHHRVAGRLTLLITTPGTSPYQLVLHPRL